MPEDDVGSFERAGRQFVSSQAWPSSLVMAWDSTPTEGLEAVRLSCSGGFQLYWRAETLSTAQDAADILCAKMSMPSSHTLTALPTNEPNYWEWINSPTWHAKSQSRKRSAKSECEICHGQRGGLQTHHRHYQTVGAELRDDLGVMCQPHHAKQSGKPFSRH